MQFNKLLFTLKFSTSQELQQKIKYFTKAKRGCQLLNLFFTYSFDYKYVIKGKVDAFDQQLYCQLLELTQLCRAKCFINNNHPPKKYKILNLINHIDFIELKYLHLDDTKIDSIEPLQWMYCPQKTKISLKDNVITDLKPLIKILSIKLTKIDLLGNKINHSKIQILSRANLKESQQLLLIWQTLKVDSLQLIDCPNSLAKLQSGKIKKKILISRFVTANVMRVFKQKLGSQDAIMEKP